MTLYLFLFVSLGLHLLLQYLLLPRLEGRGAGGQKTFRKSAALAVFKYLSTTLLLAAATYALIVVIVFVLSLTRPVTSAEFGAAIANIQWFQSKFKIFREFWTLWLFLMLLLAYVAYRRSRKAAAEVAQEPLPPLPPNAEIEEVMRKIGECEQRAARLELSWVRSDDELAMRKRELAREAEALRAQLREADVRRRALPSAPAEGAPPPLESYGGLRRFLASKGFFKTLESTTRSLGYAGTVLLALCVVGVNVPVLHRALSNRALRLGELQVEASKAEALQSYEGVMADEEATAPPQFSEEDRRAIEEAARLFEQAFTSSKDLRREEEEEDDNPTFFSTRSHLVRDQIIRDFRRNPPDGGPPSGPKGPNDNGPSGPRGEWGPDGVGPNHEGTGGGGGGVADDLRAQLVNDDRGPRTQLGRNFAATLEKEVAARPRLLEKLKGKLRAYKASFREPVAPVEYGKFAFGEAVGFAVDKSWDAPNEVGRQGMKVFQTALKDAAKNFFAQEVRGGKASLRESVVRIYDTLKYRFVSDVAGEPS
ncbi:MAG: hypothetical protein ABR603_13250, partial [Pyrinomonadaceae bacterium]